MVRNPVLLVLVAAGLLGGLGLAFLDHAPNRLVSGTPIPLSVIARGTWLLALLPGIVLLAGAFLPQRRATQAVLAAAAAGFLVTLSWLAGAQAAALADVSARAARTSLGGGFWALVICAGLALIDAERRLGLPRGGRILVAIAIAGALGLLAASGALDQLAIVREYAERRVAFADAILRHIAIVLWALAPAVVLGVPLGLLAQRHRRVRAGLFPALNLLQTIPSIALFGLLMAPLSALAVAFPSIAALGIAGVGMAPAVIALFLYSLLPIARNSAEGIDAVPAAVIEAASGIGMTPGQVLRRVTLPLALPVLLAGLRIATVQAVGLAAVAALIGAGGLGSIMFQGLFADALDLVLLGAVPMVLLALAADALLKLAADHARRRPA